MSKFIKLLGHAHVLGRLRSPAEGVLHLNDEDAQRLLDDKLGEDVSADFSADDHKSIPTEAVVMHGTDAAAAAAMVPHDVQATSLTRSDIDTTAPAKKPGAKKE